ncbi:hypothetical protein ACF0H5_006239 [Mactra antiquata]
MEFYKKIVTVWIFLVAVETTNAGTFSDQQQLYSDLESLMAPSIRPVINQDDKVNVTITPYIISIVDVNEKQQSLTTSIAFRISWICETIRWNSSMYGGINVVHVEPSNIWTPDLAYMNANGKNGVSIHAAILKVAIYSNGFAHFLIGELLQSTCTIDITKYPFDTQVCPVIIGKLYYDDSMMMILTNSNKVSMNIYEENGEWALIDTHIENKELDDASTNVQFTFYLKRRTLYYCLNIYLPLMLLSAMNILSFKLPANSGERIGYCVSLLLTFVVFLNMISDAMPKVSLQVSYLQLYINIQFILGIAITTLSMYLVQLSYSDDDASHFQWIKRLYKFSCCNKRKDSIAPEISTNDDSKQEEFETNLQKEEEKVNYNNNNNHFDKITAMKFIDDVCFWIFSALFVLTTLVCLLFMVT